MIAKIDGFGHTTITTETGELISVSGGRDLETHIKMVGLIIAAPDLLEACEAVIKACEKDGNCENGIIECYPEYSINAFNGVGDPIIEYYDCPYCSLARKAIAKAKGEQHGT